MNMIEYHKVLRGVFEFFVMLAVSFLIVKATTFGWRLWSRAYESTPGNTLVSSNL